MDVSGETVFEFREQSVLLAHFGSFWSLMISTRGTNPTVL